MEFSLTHRWANSYNLPKSQRFKDTANFAGVNGDWVNIKYHTNIGRMGQGDQPDLRPIGHTYQRHLSCCHICTYTCMWGIHWQIRQTCNGVLMNFRSRSALSVGLHPQPPKDFCLFGLPPSNWAQECTIEGSDKFLSNILLITLIAACLPSNFLRCTFSHESLFESEH